MTVAVLEKEREVAPHQTGHNSGVVRALVQMTWLHAGVITQYMLPKDSRRNVL